MTMTQEDESGINQILGGFQRFAGGIEARPAAMIDTEHVVTQERVKVAVPHVNGELPGEIADVDFWVSLAQLQLAPADDLLNSRYDPKEDPEFEQYKSALHALGDRIPSLPVIPANRDVMLPDGVSKPLYLVYDLPYVYYALIDLKRARAKIHIPPVTNPGAILLHAMGREGQLRREPSILEICRASKRLKEYYGYTVEEIAEQQAANREDRMKPSPQVIYNQINVAGLPEIVQDMFHRKQILWTHARDLAEAFLGDDLLCEQLAILASQGRRMTVEDFSLVIKRLKGKLSHLELGEDGVIREIRVEPTLKLVPDRMQSERTPDLPGIERLMVAKPALIRREASRFSVTLVPAETPEKMAVSPDSFVSLITWLAERRTNTSIRDVEAVLLGFREAIRLEAQRQGLVNNQGIIAPQVDATHNNGATG
jgi:hypothetical protein